MFFSEALAAFLKRVLYYVVVVPARFMLRITLRMLIFTYTNTLGRIAYAFVRLLAVRRTERYRRNLSMDICFNFKDLGEAK
jgi:hypothetical protein